jgi:hypothetical protein
MQSTTKAVFVLSASALLFGCSSSSTPIVGDSGTDTSSPPKDAAKDITVPTDTGNPDTSPPEEAGPDSSPDGGSETGPTFPSPPTLGTTQIDRMGRPGVNTALNHSFDANNTTKQAAKDAYNQDTNPTNWTTYVPEFEANLAIIDGVDGVCGNQLLADTTKTDATRYATMAGVLASDMVWVNTAGKTCTTYLAVEANAVGILPNSDCGGRGLAYDVMNETYSVLAAGALSGVSDGTTPVASKTNGTAFPYLGAPLP